MNGNVLRFPNNTSFIDVGNKVYSSYLPDETLMTRQFRSVRTRTTVRVNSKGDTIVRTIREPVIDRTLYRGDWEISGYPGSGGWRINTPEGIASIVRNGADAAGRTFTHLWYVRDRLGSVRTVVDDEGTIRQCTMYYPSGLPVQLFGTERVTDRAHIGNRWSNFAGLGWHDNIDRWHDAILDRFTTPDPKAADYPSFSPYTHCAANPLRFTDPTGMDIYCFDGNGTLIKVIEDNGNDKVSIGTYEDGTYAAYYTEELNGHGVINPYYTTTYETDGVRYEVEAFKVRGDENAEKAFETLADQTCKEWSLFQTGKSGEKGLNFLSTSHKGASDISGSYIFNRQLKFGYTIRAHHHNHPRGTAQESDADRTFRDIVRGVTRQNVLFYVYTTRTGAIDYTNNKK